VTLRIWRQLCRVEFGENTRLSNLASATLARRMNTGKPSSQILAEDDEYQRFSRIANEQIADANKQLAILRPKLESMKVVLESVDADPFSFSS